MLTEKLNCNFKQHIRKKRLGFVTFKYLLLIACAGAFAGVVIGWLMFGGNNPIEVVLDNGVKAKFSAMLRDTEVRREQNGQLLWNFKVDEVINDQTVSKTFLKGIKGKIFRNDGTYFDIIADIGEMETDGYEFRLKKNVIAEHSQGVGRISADEIIWNKKTEIIMAAGNVQMWKDDWYAQGNNAETTSAFKKILLKGNAKVVKQNQ
ncbi:MAG: LPS export ABC transporter periplasmic protein LptC [Acidaminococcaceae bacterium]|nr:LPS export ABC transporter periplasmic protein LptC [Acidaminococcaceae bacterium]